MPVISITLLSGYSAQAESRLVDRVALAARSVIAAAAAGTTVFVQHAHTYQRDGKVFTSGGPERVDAALLVRTFLEHMQARDLTAAARLLAPDFQMLFPGAPAMTGLDQLVAWARGRYRSVAKTYDHVDESWGADAAVVHCSGSLHGEWLDGTAFSGIRFIDRFEVANDLIRRQEVWNDLALHQRANAAPDPLAGPGAGA